MNFPDTKVHKNIGLMIHWGLYSVPAFDDPKSVARRRLKNGSEWYLKRLIEKGNFRPVSGWKETQLFHEKNYKDKSYYSFSKELNEEKLNVLNWVCMAKLIGASYIVLTTKHHDGFCLWPTKTSDMHTNKDILLEYVTELRKYGLKVGFYYSWSEFTKSCSKDYLDNTVKVQIKELLEYKPDIWWFDGDWECKTVYARNTIQDLIKLIKKKNHSALINDRVGQKIEDKLPPGSTFRNFEDRFIPSSIPKLEWEHVNTVGNSWGYNKYQPKEFYKSGKELYAMYKKVNDLGGKFLINIGPDKNGKPDKNELKSLIEFACFIRYYDT